jgi:CRISPR-associated protein Csd2
MSLTNRYEFMYFVECIDGNPNGDPDAGNAPRIDPQDMHGLISDVAVKRRIRNYVQLARNAELGYGIMVQQASNLNRFIAMAIEANGGDPHTKTKGRPAVQDAQRWLCQNYFDVRTFGGVLATGANAGQLRGPVQLTFLRSLDPILPLDVSITRMAVAATDPKVKTSAEYQKWEEEQDEDTLRTMGRKQMIPYGLYEGRGFISANLADQTGFGEQDLALLWESLLNMYEHDRSSSKGQMSTVPPLIIFKHTGTDTDPEQRARQTRLGCAPAHQLFDLVSAARQPSKPNARSFQDYVLTIRASALPSGVKIGLVYPHEGRVHVAWDGEIANQSWLVVK